MHSILLSDRSLYPTIQLKTPFEYLSWVDGRQIAEPVPRLEFIVEGNEPFQWCDYFRPAANIPLFSAKMRAALDGAGVSNVEYFECIVSHVQTGVSNHYWAANIVGLVAGVDRDQSVFEPFDDSPILIDDFSRLVLDEGRLTGLSMVRLAEFDLLVVIDAGVSQAIESAGLLGVRVQKPEEWDCFAT